MMMSGMFTENGSLDLDSRSTLWSVFLVGVIAPEVFIVQPGFVQGLVEHIGFDDQGAGYTASAEMFGLALTTILMTFTAHRVNWRVVIFWNLGQVAISGLLHRYPNLELGGQAVHQKRSRFRGYTSLPVRLNQASATGRSL